MHKRPSRYEEVLSSIIKDRERLSVPCRIVDREEGDSIAAKLKNAARVLDNKRGCLGLAANQLGFDGRVMVVKKGKRFKALINPVLIAGTGKVVSEESCFSFPGLTSTVERFTRITVKADNTATITLRKMEAIAFQHELDHLNGICI